MDCKIEFCVKLGKSTTETPQMFHEAFGEHSLRRTAVFEWHSHFKVSHMSVESDNHSGQPSNRKQQRMLKKLKHSSTKIVAEQSMSSQTLFGSVMEFAKGH
jgi:hypothetical protein